MEEDADGRDNFADELKRTLSACGVPADAIQVRYEHIIQGYDIIVSCGSLSDTQIECIWNAAHMVGHVTFTDDRNKALELEIWSRRDKAQKREFAASLPDLPRYDPSQSTLAEFARAIECYCGVEPGSLLEAVNERLLVLRSTSLPFASGEARQHWRVLKVAGAALVDHQGIQVGVIGGT